MDSYSSLEQYKQEQCHKLFNELLSFSRQGMEFVVKFNEVMNIAKNDDIYLDFLYYLNQTNARTNLKKIDELQLNFTNIIANQNILTDTHLQTIAQILKLGIRTEGMDVERDFKFLTEFYSEQEIKDIEYAFITTNLKTNEELEKLLDSNYVYLLSSKTLSYYAIDNNRKREIIKKSINITEADLVKYKREYEDEFLGFINELQGIEWEEVKNQNPKGLSSSELVKYSNIVNEICEIKNTLPQTISNEDLFLMYLYGDNDGIIKNHKKAKYDIPFLFSDEIEDIRKIMLLQFNEGENINETIQALKLNKIKKIAISKILFLMKNDKEKKSFTNVEALLAIKRVLSLKTNNVSKDLLELIASKTNISDIDSVLSANQDSLQSTKSIIPRKDKIVTTKDLLMFAKTDDKETTSVEETDFENLLNEMDNYDFINIVPSVGVNGKQVLKKILQYNDVETGEPKKECIIALNLNDETIRKRFFDELSVNAKLRKKIISQDNSVLDFCRIVNDSEFYRYQVNSSADIYKKLFLLRSQSSVKSFKTIGKRFGTDPREDNVFNRLNFSDYTLSCNGVQKILEIASLSDDNFYEFEFTVKDLENLPNLLHDFWKFRKNNKYLAKLPSNFRLHIKSSATLSTSQKKRIKDFFNALKEGIGTYFGIDKITIENDSLGKMKVFRKNSFIYNNIKPKKSNCINERLSRLFKQQDKFASTNMKYETKQNTFETKDAFQQEIGEFKELDVNQAIKMSKERKENTANKTKFGAPLGAEGEGEDIENQLEQELEIDEEQQMEMNLLYNLSKKPETNKNIPEKSIIEERNCYTRIQEILNDPTCADAVKIYLKTILTRNGAESITETECRDFFLKITEVSSSKIRNKNIKKLGGKLANKALTKEAFVQCVKNIIKFGNPRLNIIGQDPFFETFETEKGVIVVDTNANSLSDKKPHPILNMLSTYPTFTENIDKASDYQQAISKINDRYGEEFGSEVAENIQSIFDKLPDFPSKERLLMQRPAMINPDALVYISRNKSVFDSFISEMKNNVPNNKELGQTNLQKIYEKIFINIMANFGKNKPQQYGSQLRIYDVPDIVKICNGCKSIFGFLNKSIRENILDADSLAFMMEKNPNIFQDGEQSAGIFYTTLLKAKYKARAEVIRQRVINGENVGDIDVNNPEEVEKYLSKNPLSNKEKQIIKASLEYSMLTMSHRTAHLDVLTLIKQELTEVYTSEDTNTTPNIIQDIENIDTSTYKIYSTTLPTKKNVGTTMASQNDANGIEYDFMTFLFQERERWFDGRLKEELTAYQRDLINHRNDIIIEGIKIMKNKNLGLEYKRAFYNILINGNDDNHPLSSEFLQKLAKVVCELPKAKLALIQKIDIPANKLLRIISTINQAGSKAEDFLTTLSAIKEKIGDNNFAIIGNYVDYDFDKPDNHSLTFLKTLLACLEKISGNLPEKRLKQPMFGKILAIQLADNNNDKLKSKYLDVKTIVDTIPGVLPHNKTAKTQELFKEKLEQDIVVKVSGFLNGLNEKSDIEVEKEFLQNDNIKNKLEELTIEKIISQNIDSTLKYHEKLFSDRPVKNIVDNIINTDARSDDDIETLCDILVAKDNSDKDYGFFNNSIDKTVREKMSTLCQKIFKESLDRSQGDDVRKHIAYLNRICIKYNEDAVALTNALEKIYNKHNSLAPEVKQLLNTKNFLEILYNICEDNEIRYNKRKVDIEELANVFINQDILTVFFEKDDSNVLEPNNKKVSVGRIQDFISTAVCSTFLDKNQKHKLLKKIAKLNSKIGSTTGGDSNGISTVEKNLGTSLRILEELDDDIKKQKNALIDHNFLINIFNNCIEDTILNIERTNDVQDRIKIANNFKDDILYAVNYIKNLNAILREAKLEGNKENITNISNFITQFKQTCLENGYLIQDIRKRLDPIPAQEISNKLGTRALKYISKIDEEELSSKIFEEITKIEQILGEDILSTNYSHSELLKLLKKKEKAEKYKQNIKYSVDAHEKDFLLKECQLLDGLNTNRELYEKIEKANKQFSNDIINIYDETKNIAKDIEKLSKKYDSEYYLPDAMIFNTSGLNLIKAIDDTVFDIQTSDENKRKLKRQLQYVYGMAGLLIQDENELNMLSAKLNSKIKQETEKENDEEDEENEEEKEEDDKEKKNNGLTDKEWLQLYACYLAKYKKKNNILLRPEQLGPSILAKNDRKIVIRMKTGTGKTKTIDFTAFNSLKEGKTPVIIAPNEVLLEQHLADLKQCPDIDEENIYIITKTSIYRANTKEIVTDEDEIKKIVENKNMCNVLLSTANDLDFFRKKKLQSKEGIEFLTIMKEKGVLLQDEIDSSVDPFSSNKNAKPSEVVGFKEYDLAEYYFNSRTGIGEGALSKEQIIENFFALTLDNEQFNKNKPAFEYLKLRANIDIENLLQNDNTKTVSDVIDEKQKATILNIIEELDKDYENAMSMQQDKNYAVVYYTKNNKTYADYRIIINDKITDKSNRFSRFVNYFVRNRIKNDGNNVEPVMANVMTDSSVALHLHKYFNKVVGFTATPKDNDIWISNNFKVRGFESVNVDNRKDEFKQSTLIEDEDKKNGKITTRSKAILFANMLFMALQNKGVKPDEVLDKTKELLQDLRDFPNISTKPELKNIVNELLNNDFVNNLSVNAISTYQLSFFEGTKKVKSIAKEMSDRLEECFQIIDTSKFENIEKPEIFALESSEGEITMQTIKNKVKKNPKNLFIFGTMEYGVGCDFPDEPRILNFETHLTKEKQYQIFGRTGRSGRYGSVVNYPEYSYQQFINLIRYLRQHQDDDKFDPKLKAWMLLQEKKVKQLLIKEDDAERKNIANDLLASLNGDNAMREPFFQANLNYNSLKEMMQWKKHETIENLKEEFSDKINIAISVINEDEGVPFDVKNQIIKEIEFESSRYINYILDPYLKNSLEFTDTLKQFETKNKETINAVKKNIDEKINNILYQKCVISYSDEEKPKKKAIQYINNIIAKINRTFNSLRTNVENEKEENINGSSLNDGEPKERKIADRLNFNKKAFLKTYLEEENENGEKIQRKYSLQRITRDNNNNTKIMLSAIGNAIECGMDIKSVDIFEQTTQSSQKNMLLLGIQKKENTKKDIDGKKDSGELLHNLNKTQDNDYKAIWFKNRAIVASKKVLNDSGNETTKNIFILSTDTQNLTSDIKLLYHYSKTQNPDTKYVIQHETGVLSLNQEQLEQIVVKKKPIAKFDQDYRNFISAFPREMIDNTVPVHECRKKLTPERAKAMYTKYLIEDIMSEEDVSRGKKTTLAEKLKDDFVKKFNKQSLKDEQQKKDFIVESLIDDKINASVLSAFSKMYSNDQKQSLFAESNPLEYTQANNILNYIRSIKRNPTETFVDYKTQNFNNVLGVDNADKIQQFNNDSAQKLLELKKKMYEHKNHYFSISDDYIDQINDKKMMLSKAVQEYAKTITEEIANLDKEIENANISFEDKNKLKNSLLEDIKDEDKMDIKMDKYRKIITEAIKLDSLILTSPEYPNDLDLAEKLNTNQEWFAYENIINIDNLEEMKEKLEQLADSFSHKDKNNNYIVAKLGNNDQEMKLRQIFQDKYNNATKNIALLNNVINEITNKKNYIDATLKGIEEKFITILEETEPKYTSQFFEENLKKFTELYNEICKDIDDAGGEEEEEMNGEINTKKLSPYHRQMLKQYLEDKIPDIITKIVSDNHHLLFNGFSLEGMFDEDGNLTEETLQALEEQDFSEKEIAIFDKIINNIYDTISTEPINDGKMFDINDEENEQLFEKIKQVYTEAGLLDADNKQQALEFQNKMVKFLFGRIQKQKKEREKITKKLNSDLTFSTFNGPNLQKKVNNNIKNGLEGDALEDRYNHLTNQDLQDISTQNNQDINQQLEMEKKMLETEKSKHKDIPLPVRVFLALFPGCLIIPWFFKEFRDKVFGEDVKQENQEQHTPIVNPEKTEQHATNILQTQQAQNLNKQINNSKFIKYQLEQNNKQNKPDRA